MKYENVGADALIGPFGEQAVQQCTIQINVGCGHITHHRYMASNIKQRKQIHLRNFNYKGSSFVYYITICTSKKQPYFQNEKITRVIADEMEFRRANKEMRLFCYCIMPDHLHMLLSFTEDYHKTLQNWVSAFKRYTTRVVNGLYGIKPLWQKNFYDHIVRKEESLLKIAEYILNNPVRKGMVPNWEDYPYSKIADPLPL